MKNTVSTFAAMKSSGEKISILTCYDYSTAKLIDAAGINAILVGDSLGSVILGYPDTLAVTVDDMVRHGAAVARGARDAMVIVDMPFMSYQTGPYDALVNAGRIIRETHCSAVKLEGGAKVCPQIRAIVDAGIPVMGHIGLTPQSVNAFGGFKVQGKSAEAAERLLQDALALQEAGCFAVTVECVPAEVAAILTERLAIPVIGIGAGAGCDGQVLVYQDMLGMFSDFTPKFVKKFADVGSVMREAFAEYDRQVKSGEFPAAEHSFKAGNDTLKRLY